MSKISISLSHMQLVSDAVARCYTADIDDFRFRLELAQFKKAVNDHMGPESAYAETRKQAFEKYGVLDQESNMWQLPKEPERQAKLIQALEDALSVMVSVPFPELTAEKLVQIKAPLNASEMAVLISCGVLKTEE